MLYEVITGEHGHAPINTEKALATGRSRHGDLGQLLGIGVGINRTVGKAEDTILAELRVLGDHQKDRGDGLDPRGWGFGAAGCYPQSRRSTYA